MPTATVENPVNVSKSLNKALHAFHLNQTSNILEIFHRIQKIKTTHLDDRLSVSDSLACIKHKPVRKRADRHYSAS